MCINCSITNIKLDKILQEVFLNPQTKTNLSYKEKAEKYYVLTFMEFATCNLF